MKPETKKKLLALLPYLVPVVLAITVFLLAFFLPSHWMKDNQLKQEPGSKIKVDAVDADLATLPKLPSPEDTVFYLTVSVYTNEDFKIPTYQSSTDQDNDGIDDQTDIYQGALAYVATNPEYASEYHQGGYSWRNEGVCTDVIAKGFLAAGYDLMELINEDIELHPEDYAEDPGDANIAFRRVENMAVFFAKYAISLTTDLNDLAAWQPGDIIVFEEHIGFVADRRNVHGIPYMLHHGSEDQVDYIEDKLEENAELIIGHYRWR